MPGSRRTLLLVAAQLAAAGLAIAAPREGGRSWRPPLLLARKAVERGDLAGAEKHLNVAILRLGEPRAEHLEVFDELQVLGALVADTGRLEKGRRLVRRAMGLATDALGEENPALEPFHSMMGILELQAGDAAGAADHLGFSYRALDGKAPVTNPAFQEVLQSYVEALRQLGDTREFLAVFSRYGHLVDLGPLQETPPGSGLPASGAPEAAGPETLPGSDVSPVAPTGARHPADGLALTHAPARTPGSNPWGIGVPVAPPPDSAEVDGVTPLVLEVPGTGSAPSPGSPQMGPPANRFPPRVIQHAKVLLGRQIDALGPSLAKLRGARRWARRQLRAYRGRRRFRKDRLQRTLREAMIHSRKVAVLALAPGRLRKTVEKTAVPELTEAFQERIGDVERYERQVSDVVSSLQELFAVLKEQLADGRGG